MNRNVITEADVRKLRASNTTAPVDTYFDRLLKFVPAEVITAYVLLEGNLRQVLDGTTVVYGLGVLLAAGVVLTVLVAKYVLKIERTSQIVVSVTAFTVWVFATGGWFAAAFPEFWKPGWGNIAVIGFALVVGIARLPPLPDPERTLLVRADSTTPLTVV